MKFILLLLIPTLSFAQNDRIDYIRKKFKEINTNIEDYKKVEDQPYGVIKDLSPENYSYESTTIYRIVIINMTRYYKDNILVKAELTFDGDRATLKSEYYYDDKGLLFAFQQHINYDEPKWSDKFDPQKNTTDEHRYYFDNNRLIRWIDENGFTTDHRSSYYEQLEKERLSDSELYRNYKDI